MSYYTKWFVKEEENRFPPEELYACIATEAAERTIKRWAKEFHITCDGAEFTLVVRPINQHSGGDKVDVRFDAHWGWTGARQYE